MGVIGNLFSREVSDSDVVAASKTELETTTSLLALDAIKARRIRRRADEDKATAKARRGEDREWSKLYSRAKKAAQKAVSARNTAVKNHG